TSTAATSRRSNSRLPTTLNARDQPPAEVSDQRVSGLTGAVHRGQAYYQRLQDAGKTKRAALRCLKRRLARTVFQALRTVHQPS
ncbi:hypothetical protein ACNJP4_21305, partial [Mycobacterium tuberculosis]